MLLRSSNTNGGRNDLAYERVVAASSLLVLGAILIAGLWPFCTPKNDVHWLKNENGIYFGRYGSIVTSGVFPVSASTDAISSTLEVWLEPNLDDEKNTILSFEGLEGTKAPFDLQQNKDVLRIRRHNVDSLGTLRMTVFGVRGVFRRKKRVFVTIVLREHNTATYVDGVLAGISPPVGVSRNNFTGRLVVANSLTVNDSWSGQIMGLAVYNRQLTPAQVSKHYDSWRTNGQPAIAKDEAPVAVYLFNEHQGGTVHNRLDPATNLVIPGNYFVLHPRFLMSAWRNQDHDWGYWSDVGINITGFIPVGFLFLTYLSSVRHIKRPEAMVVLLGFALSFAIETSQRFLPTRDSDMTDVMTNTLGTVIGVTAYRCSFVRALFTTASGYVVSVLRKISRRKGLSSSRETMGIELLDRS